MVPSARSHIAGESKRSRWDRSRASLVLPIGVIVAVAIVCVIVAVLTSAQRADEVSYNNEQQLVRQAMVDHGLRALHLLQGAAATSVAATKIRDNSDTAWMDKRFGPWLEQYFHSDVEVIVDAGDRILYSHALDPADNDASRLAAALVPNIDLMRGRLQALPEHTIPVLDLKDPAKPGRSSALLRPGFAGSFRSSTGIVCSGSACRRPRMRSIFGTSAAARRLASLSAGSSAWL